MPRDFKSYAHAPAWEEHFDPSYLQLPAADIESFSYRMLAGPSAPPHPDLSSTPLSPSSLAQIALPPLAPPPPSHSNFHIPTSFSYAHKINQTIPVDPKNRKTWTSNQTALAEKASRVENIAELTDQVSLLLFTLPHSINSLTATRLIWR